MYDHLRSDHKYCHVAARYACNCLNCMSILANYYLPCQHHALATVPAPICSAIVHPGKVLDWLFCMYVLDSSAVHSIQQCML